MNGWVKAGVLDRGFEELEVLSVLRVKFEFLFRRIERFRRVFTRHDKTDIMFMVFITIAGVADLLRHCEHDLVEIATEPREIVAVPALAERFRQRRELCVVDPAVPPRGLFGGRDLEALARL